MTKKRKNKKKIVKNKKKIVNKTKWIIWNTQIWINKKKEENFWSKKIINLNQILKKIDFKIMYSKIKYNSIMKKIISLEKKDFSIFLTSFFENIKLIIIFLSFYVIFLYFSLNYSFFWIFISQENLLTAIFILLLLFSFFFFKRIVIYFSSIYKTRRIDIILTYVFFFHIINNSFNFSEILYWYYIFFFIFGNLIRVFFLKNNQKWILVKDKVLESDDIDELWFDEKAKDFSDILYNNGSLDNQVFGLVAEWWTGKSSFLKKLQSTDKIKNNCIYVEFNPWYYENEKELLEKFLDNIITNLKKEWYYLPKLSKTFDKFTKLLDSNSSTFFWLNLTFSSNLTLIDLKDSINESLKSIDKKIIIVIDDLDRISSQKLKEIFKIVDLCREFHNTNYILCYDPSNFNSVDEGFIEEIHSKDWKIHEVVSQNIDNKELVKYMWKIINVYYPLTVDKVLLKKYFIKIFTESEKINFSENSNEAIKIWIERLFNFENYVLWGKYYSNVRLIKRVLNNLISVTQWTDKVDLFHSKHWVQFDTLVKFSILALYFHDIFVDIDNECNLDDIENNYSLIAKYKLAFSIDKDTENFHYIKFINSLNYEKSQLLLNLIPKLEDWNMINRSDLSIRKWNNLNKYTNILNNRKTLVFEDINFNVFIELQMLNFQSWSSLEEIFENTNQKYGKKWTNQLVLEFRDKIWWWNIAIKKEKIITFIDFIITYSNFYDYSKDFDFTFYFDIADILDKPITWNNTDQENLTFIHDYFYWEWEYTKPIFKKIFEKWEEIWTQKGKIIALREALRLLFSVDESRWWGLYNFSNWVWWIEKVYNWVFSEFKERYIDNNINIFNMIFDWEQSEWIKWYSVISHITYMLAHYADETSKKELTDYFIKCFDEKIEYFTNFLYLYAKTDKRSRDYQYYFELNDFFDNFIKRDIVKFVWDNEERLKALPSKHLNILNKYQWWEDVKIDRKELIEKFLELINK